MVPEEANATGSAKERAASPDSSSAGPSVAACASLEQDHGDKTGEMMSIEENEVKPQVRVNSKEELGRNPGEIAFFKLLHSEFQKAAHFFDKAQQEFTIREERVREGMEIMKRPNSIMVNEKWSMLAKSIYRLYKDLLLLETFAIMTYCSFSKILKKHDKVTGHNTRAAFMSNIVGKANFTNYPKLLEMIRRCEDLYSEVSDRLVQEGKEGLYEDERLFINMISRLNEQALETPDAPEHTAGRQVKVPSAPVLSKAESENVARLRSLVESNEFCAANVSEGATDDDVQKRQRTAHPDGKLPATKRPKVDK